MSNVSASQLREALSIREQIEKLEARFNQIVGGGSSSPSSGATASAKVDGRRGRMSAASRAKIAAAARARWARVKGTSSPAAAKSEGAKPARKKGGLTAEGRARLAAAMKARWAARKKGGAAPNSASKKS